MITRLLVSGRSFFKKTQNEYKSVYTVIWISVHPMNSETNGTSTRNSTIFIFTQVSPSYVLVLYTPGGRS